MNTRISMIVTVSIASLLGLVALAHAQKKSVTDPAEADADFRVQGEYSGELVREGGNEKVGVQVIALGDGRFDAVGYSGGLPGDGWNPEQGRPRAEGQIRDGVTTFRGEHGTATIRDGVLSVFSADGDPIGTLRKVQRKSPTLGVKPPQGAVILFDGTSAEAFRNGRISEDGLLMQGVTSKQQFGSCTLHLEFLLPYEPHGRGQERANSGCYLQGRYEVQILDSFGLEGKSNECGGIYGISDPAVNMCFPPLSWQAYDIDFTAAEFDASGNKIRNARMTVRHNGVVVQENVELPRTTTAAPVSEGPGPGPLYLQDHGHPVHFRNIWLVEKN